MSRFDVYSFGVVSSSTLYRIEAQFPGAAGYAEIDSVRHMTGGEATNSSIVLARLGATVKLDGNWLGAEDGGRRTKKILDGFRIDSSRLPLRDGYSGVQEVVFSAAGTRTIFGTYGRLLEDGDWNMPHKQDIEHATAICLDPFFGEASARVAEIGSRRGIPVVTVDCRFDNPLLRHASAVVIAESFIKENYAEHSPGELFREYQDRMPGLVIFTFGDREAWYGRPGTEVRTRPAYAVDPVDTTGAGDSFRAGIVYGYLEGWSDEQMIDFASGLAALVCTRFPGVLHAPTLEEVTEFIGENRPAGG